MHNGFLVIGDLTVAVTVAFIVTVVELSLACLYSKLRFVVVTQRQDLNTIDE
jgi:hypothetical protein